MHLEVILPVLIGALALTAVARKLRWPAPLLVTAVACAVSFIPGLNVGIDSEGILTLVLPPLLYSAALDITFQDFHASLRQIRRLGIFLVVITALVVGGVANVLIGDISVPAALLLGAIVAPPDAVSASAIGKQLGLPRRVMTVLSGESLINDGAALTLYTLFLNGATKGSKFGVGEGLLLLIVNIVVGLAVGLAIAVVIQFVRVRLKDPLIETVLGLIVPFAAFLLAEHLGGSGVLGVVASGLYLGYNAPKGSYVMRLQEQPIWASVDVLLEAFVFALIGLQFKNVLVDTIHSERGLGASLGIALIVLALCVVIRPIYVFLSYYQRQIPYFKRRSERKGRNEPTMTWRDLTVISWTGMRGVVTLAAAAAVVADPTVPARDLILLSAFVVTIGTLLLQGLSLPWVIKVLKVGDPDQEKRDRKAEKELINRTYRIAMERMQPRWDALRSQVGDKKADKMLARIKDTSMNRLRMLQEDSDEDEAQRSTSVPSEASEGAEPANNNSLTREMRFGGRSGAWNMRMEMSGVMLDMRREINDMRRRVLIEERDKGRVDEEAMRTVLMELDTEEFALDQSWVSRMRS